MYATRRGSHHVQRFYFCHSTGNPPTIFNRRSLANSTVKQSVENNRASFQDPTLIWAQSTPEVAQKCLEPPFWEDWKQCDVTFDSEKTLSLEGYLKWRRWPIPNENEIDTSGDNIAINATALISHVLSAPLTLANQLGNLEPYENQDIGQQRWCCVGARAEATLRPMYWKELLLMRNKEYNHEAVKTSSYPNILLEFVGPDIQLNGQNITVALGSSGSLSIRSGFRGLYHEDPQRLAHSSPWDAFVFFNPGFGHPNLQTSWEATLHKILQELRASPGRMLFTAHSEKDADRDSKLLWEKFGLRVQYRENPFASRIRYQDPFEPDHYVQPNHHVAFVEFSKEATSSDPKKTTRRTFDDKTRSKMCVFGKVTQNRFAHHLDQRGQGLLKHCVIRPFSTSTSTSDDEFLKFNTSTLGLDYVLIRPVLSSIRQLPEVESVWKSKDNFASESTLFDLDRASQVFAAFQKGGREHLAVRAMIAECQQRLGLYHEVLKTLEEMKSTAVTESLPPDFQHDMLLAQAKAHWTNGDFEQSQKLCESIIATYDDFEEKFPTTNLHLASAMTGKALSQLASMNTLQDAYSVRDFFRIATKFLQRHPPTRNSLPQAAVLLNEGIAEVLYALFLEETNNVSVPMDSALRAWFQGLQKAVVSKNCNTQVMAASQFMQANFQSNIAWGVLNYEQDRSDRLSKASDFAKKALLVYDDPNAVLGKEGLSHVLSVVASCYFHAESAVTAEGLFQSAIDRKGDLLGGTLRMLQLKEAYLQYSELCKNWEKREGDANRLVGESEIIDASLPQNWRGKSGMYGNLWFWTPGEMQ
jgi:hypothetical protein